MGADIEALKIPLVTVTFEGDFRLTLLQALSVDRLFELEQISRYVLILNCPEEEYSLLRGRFEDALSVLASDALRKKIQFLRWEDFYPNTSRVGFYDQQVLKLAVARLITEECYLLLDGKNHFVRKSSLDDFFVDGKPIGELVTTSDYWRANLTGSMSMLDIIDDGANSKYMFPSITPIVMNTEIARSLVSDLETRFEKPLPSIFQGREGNATEFLLYYSYLLKRDLLGLYANAPTPVHTFFMIWPQEQSVINRYLEDCSNGRTPMFGLHRRRIPQLTASQVDAISRMWHLELLRDWEDAEWFMGL